MMGFEERRSKNYFLRFLYPILHYSIRDTRENSVEGSLLFQYVAKLRDVRLVGAYEPCDDDTQDFRGAFANFQEFLIPVEAFNVIFLHETIAAVELDCVLGRAAHHFRSVEFCHGSLFGEWLALVLEAARFV